jgi:hypothetical protein
LALEVAFEDGEQLRGVRLLRLAGAAENFHASPVSPKGISAVT